MKRKEKTAKSKRMNEDTNSKRIIIAAKEFSEKTTDTVKKTRAWSSEKKAIAIVLFIVLSLAFQLFLLYYNSSAGTLQTQTVVFEKQPISVDVNAYITRDETRCPSPEKSEVEVGGKLIEKKLDGFYSQVVEDGEFVSKGQIIAYVFSTAEEKKRYDEYRTLLPNLEALVRLENSALGQVDDSVRNIEIIDLLRQYEACSFTNSYDDKLRETLSNLVLKIKSGGTEEDVAQAREKLQSEIDSLLKSLNLSQHIKAPCAGYFVEGVDGYESQMDYYELDKKGMSVKKLEKLLKAKPKNTDKYYGKIVYQSNWFVNFKINSDFAGEYLKRTSSVLVSFPEKNLSDLKMTIVNKQRSGDDVCVTLCCAAIDSGILDLRNENAVVSVTSPKGYKVLKNAIHSVDSVRGVFVKRGNRAFFKPIRELYSTEDYSIVRSLTGSEYIELYGQEKFDSFILESTHKSYEKSLNKATIKDAENKSESSDDYEEKLPKIYNSMYESDFRVINDYDKIIVRGRNLHDRSFIS